MEMKAKINVSLIDDVLGHDRGRTCLFKAFHAIHLQGAPSLFMTFSHTLLHIRNTEPSCTSLAALCEQGVLDGNLSRPQGWLNDNAVMGRQFPNLFSKRQLFT